MSHRLATEQGKDYALEQLKIRREINATGERIDNSSLPAGSLMYFYCQTCGDLADTKPESYFTPPRRFCNECQALLDLGWLE
jgi:hypothetical protein